MERSASIQPRTTPKYNHEMSMVLVLLMLNPEGVSLIRSERAGAREETRDVPFEVTLRKTSGTNPRAEADSVVSWHAMRHLFSKIGHEKLTRTCSDMIRHGFQFVYHDSTSNYTNNDKSI